MVAAAGAALCAPSLGHPRLRILEASAISLNELSQPDNALAKWIDGDALRESDAAPGLALKAEGSNLAGNLGGDLGGDLGGGGAARGGVSLGSWTAAGKYVVLCFVPESSIRNGAELNQFERRRREFDELVTDAHTQAL